MSQQGHETPSQRESTMENFVNKSSPGLKLARKKYGVPAFGYINSPKKIRHHFARKNDNEIDKDIYLFVKCLIELNDDFVTAKDLYHELGNQLHNLSYKKDCCEYYVKKAATLGIERFFTGDNHPLCFYPEDPENPNQNPKQYKLTPVNVYIFWCSKGLLHVKATTSRLGGKLICDYVRDSLDIMKKLCSTDAEDSNAQKSQGTQEVQGGEPNTDAQKFQTAKVVSISPEAQAAVLNADAQEPQAAKVDTITQEAKAANPDADNQMNQTTNVDKPETKYVCMLDNDSNHNLARIQYSFGECVIPDHPTYSQDIMTSDIFLSQGLRELSRICSKDWHSTKHVEDAVVNFFGDIANGTVHLEDAKILNGAEIDKVVDQAAPLEVSVAELIENLSLLEELDAESDSQEPPRENVIVHPVGEEEPSELVGVKSAGQVAADESEGLSLVKQAIQKFFFLAKQAAQVAESTPSHNDDASSTFDNHAVPGENSNEDSAVVQENPVPKKLVEQETRVADDSVFSSSAHSGIDLIGEATPGDDMSRAKDSGIFAGWWEMALKLWGIIAADGKIQMPKTKPLTKKKLAVSKSKMSKKKTASAKKRHKSDVTQAATSVQKKKKISKKKDSLKNVKP